MKLSYFTNLKLSSFSMAFLVLLVTVSCGSYESVYNDTDGIYSPDNHEEEVVVAQPVYVPTQEEIYFAQKADEYSNIQEGDLITNPDDIYYDDNYIENDEYYADTNCI